MVVRARPRIHRGVERCGFLRGFDGARVSAETDLASYQELVDGRDRGLAALELLADSRIRSGGRSRHAHPGQEIGQNLTDAAVIVAVAKIGYRSWECGAHAAAAVPQGGHAARPLARDGCAFPNRRHGRRTQSE